MNWLQLVLEQFDNELSRKVNGVVNEIRRQRCSYLR
jgi:protein transport protein SEC24